ncbi:Phosphocarrier protein HPr /dihydroxyacetone kinase DhaM subunit [Amycolatopsis marina]|uniref:Phosphocarrier protein HPr n=1 Tax=Amycolatopsis marina TaxID=490629 RepID=A0A1I0WTE9_9PSEU|nr:dihydroxyacetone kinase phosphoryl donor subunit DhaM [Amycolatopsis marina]SFA91276.1 Phosphocarrier protein HPr /dihydroxyacetone kinase DhaM subunit [Amycolatopsis marina]
MTVGLVIVSHSAKLAEGVAELARQMAPDVAVLPAGGLPDGGIGTDYDSVLAAAGEANTGAGVVLLYDLGSAQMTAELVVESLAEPDTAVVVDAPLVEGAVAAAVTAQGGADRDRVAESAAAAGAAPDRETTPAVLGAEADRRIEVTLRNEVGLHARPAALLARSVAGLDAEVRVRLGEQEADAASVLALMSLGARQGDQIEIRVRGEQAAEAVERINALVERDFE